MARAFPLQSLLEHARHRMDAGERLLRMLGRRLEAARRRLHELHEYKQEYQQRLAGGGTRGMDIHLLRDFHVFLGKLDAAIAQQSAEVDKAEAHWHAAHQNWLGLRRKVKAYETLAGRHQRQEIARQEKLEQRLTDENALRRHLWRDRGPVS